MSQLSLQMPCLSCIPDCIWPPNPENGIVYQVLGLTNFVCLDCAFFNQVRLIPFVGSFPTVPVTCVFELALPLTCSSDRIRIATQEGIVPGTAEIIATTGSDFPFLLFNGVAALTPVEAAGNGPYPLTLTSGSALSCNLGFVLQSVEGLT